MCLWCHDIIQIHNILLQNQQYSEEYFSHSVWMWGILYRILSVPQNTIMDMNNVMVAWILEFVWQTNELCVMCTIDILTCMFSMCLPLRFFGLPFKQPQSMGIGCVSNVLLHFHLCPKTLSLFLMQNPHQFISLTYITSSNII